MRQKAGTWEQALELRAKDWDGMEKGVAFARFVCYRNGCELITNVVRFDQERQYFRQKAIVFGVTKNQVAETVAKLKSGGK